VTVLGVTVALLAALCVGYVAGLRAGRRTQSWRQRTSAAALSRQAVTLVALVAASRVQRSVRRRSSLGPARRSRRWPPGSGRRTRG